LPHEYSNGKNAIAKEKLYSSLNFIRQSYEKSATYPLGLVADKQICEKIDENSGYDKRDEYSVGAVRRIIDARGCWKLLQLTEVRDNLRE